jgi:hypothetical protein
MLALNVNMHELCNSRYSLDEFGTARRTAIVRAFIDALTRGGERFCCLLNHFSTSLSIVLGPGGTPRPIELHSHDPLRYSGDILAWLHQAAASEKEHIQTLLKHCATACTSITELLVIVPIFIIHSIRRQHS